VQFVILLIIIFSTISFKLLISDDLNYKKLKEVEEKLITNKETYLELVKIEKEIKRDLNKTNSNIKKYKKLVRKGFFERKFLEKLVFEKQNALKKNRENKNTLIKKQSLLLNNILIHQHDNYLSEIEKTSSKIIFDKTNNLITSNQSEYIELESKVDKYEISLKNLNSSLNNIEVALNSRSSDLEGLIGETIITKIEKKQNMIQKDKIIKKVSKIKSLIDDFESNRKETVLFDDFKFNSLKDILPIKKINIKKIKTAALKTGIQLSVLKETILIAPKSSLVVYADFFKGYGNMIILDLSNDYHLILSGLSNINCKTGDWLEKGMVLGDINNSNNNNFYMEFRFKGKTISPKKWAKLN
tara:strand:- start:190 stop:1260 length:1071 start_codon:yes stop_codon:yes gene_type:complete